MNVKIITQLQELPQFDTTQPVFCDIETQGLYINTRLIQFYQPTLDDIIYIVDLAPINYNQNDYKANLHSVKELMKSLHLVFYNASYDLGTLNLVPEKVDDLFYAVKSAYPEFMEFSLDKVTTKMGYGNMYAGIDKKKLQKQGFVLGAYLSQQQLKYSALDVLALAKMWEDKKIQNIIKTNMAYIVDILNLKYAIQYQQNGLRVDLETRNKELVKSAEAVERLSTELPFGFNPNSYIQVRKYLRITKSDHATLVEYALSSAPLAAKAKVIIDLKKAKKEVSYLESINTDRMYTRFNVAGAATGRFTSSGGDLPFGFNAQQIPRQFQKLFKADLDDTTVVGLDYATLELRLACTIFGDETMHQQLINGEDLHIAMAKRITGKELHPDGLQGAKDAASGMADTSYDYITHKDRTDAKSANFGFVFGMSANKYRDYAFTSYGLNFTPEQCNNIRNAYFKQYPAFKEYHEKVWKAMDKGYIYKTALGRRVKPKLGTDAINGPVQGSGGETTKLAVHYLIKNDCIRLGLDPKTEWQQSEVIKYIFNVVHDAIYLRVPKDEKEIWFKRLADAMKQGWTELLKSPLCKYKDIPMPVDE